MIVSWLTFQTDETKYRQEQEIAELKRDNYELEMKNRSLQGNLRTANKVTERENVRRVLQSGAEKQKPITDLFPCVENTEENIEKLRSMGVEDNDIRVLLTGKEITYSGNLYDREKRKTHQVRNVKTDIAKAWSGVHDNLIEQLPFQRVLQTALATTAKGFRNKQQRHGISLVRYLYFRKKLPCPKVYFTNDQ